MNDLIACPSVCTHQIYVTFMLFGLVSGGVVLLLFFLRRKMEKVHYFVLSAVFFVLFLVYSVVVVVDNCGSGCTPDGTYFNFGLFPKGALLTSPFDWLDVISVIITGG